MAVTIGGLSVTCAVAAHALAVLETSPGMMVRQPLRRAGSPLSSCDYHQAAHPYLNTAMPNTGKRGAAGRHLTKTAFVAALRDALAVADAAERSQRAIIHHIESRAPGAIRAALAAFRCDPSYAAVMAEAAVTALRKQHESALRVQLREVSAATAASCAGGGCQAVSACGTGECRLARGIWASLKPAASPARGWAVARPPCHVQAGAAFSPDTMLESLLASRPFRVAAA
jgi:hypothetical protein